MSILSPLTRAVCLVGLLVPALARGQVAGAGAAIERHGIALATGDLAAVERGEPVAKLIGTTDTRDVALIGIVRLDLPRDRYLRRVRDIRSWLRGSTREHIGVFGTPAALADVVALDVAPKDAGELRKCRAGSCTTKLPLVEMQRVAADVDWSASDAEVTARISTLARQRLVRLVEEYRERGNAALPTFDDHEPSVRAAEVAEAVMVQSTVLTQLAPNVASYLRAYPRERPAGAADIMFWSENVVARLRPILSLTHTVIYTPPEPAGWSLVLSKQLYANHYFEGALELVDVVDRVVPGEAAGVYVIVERRFRFDNLPRGGLLNIRGRAVNGLRDALIADLRRDRATP